MYSLGAFCESPGKPWDGQPCSFNSSTCGSFVQDCHGRDPGFRVSDFESNYRIGSYQFEGAKEIMERRSLTSISGPVRAVHSYVDMSQYKFTLSNGTNVQTCPPAMGGFDLLCLTSSPHMVPFRILLCCRNYRLARCSRLHTRQHLYKSVVGICQSEWLVPGLQSGGWIDETLRVPLRRYQLISRERATLQNPFS